MSAIVVTYRSGTMTYCVHAVGCSVAVRAARAKVGGRAEYVADMTVRDAYDDANDRGLDVRVCPCAKDIVRNK